MSGRKAENISPDTNSDSVQDEVLCRVVTIDRLTRDVMLVVLSYPTEKEIDYIAGQYIQILYENEDASYFSIANAPNSKRIIELHIRLAETNNFTSHVFSEMKEGDMLRVRGPYGRFYLRNNSSSPIILMAGGTGFAPIKGIIEQVMEMDSSREMHLYWGVRESCDIYCDDVINDWVKRENFRFIPVLSGISDKSWSGRTGFVHDAITCDFHDLSCCDIYASGPVNMIKAGYNSFLTLGLKRRQFFSDTGV